MSEGRAARNMQWGLPALTRQEQTILIHLAQGMTAREIAAIMYLGLSTVRTHIGNILLRLGVNTQGAAVAKLHAALHESHEAHREALTRVLQEAS